MNLRAFFVYFVFGTLVCSPVLAIAAFGNKRGAKDGEDLMMFLVFWTFALVMGLLGAWVAHLNPPRAADAGAGQGVCVGLATVFIYFFILLPMFTALTVPDKDVERALGWDALYGIFLMIPATPAAAVLGALAGWSVFKSRQEAGGPPRVATPSRLSDSGTAVVIARRGARVAILTQLLLTSFLPPRLLVVVVAGVQLIALAAFTRAFDASVPLRLRVPGCLAGAVPLVLVLIACLEGASRYWWLARGNWALLLLLALYELGGAWLAPTPAGYVHRTLFALSAVPCFVVIGATVPLQRLAELPQWIAGVRKSVATATRPSPPTPTPRFLALREAHVSYAQDTLEIDAVIEVLNVAALSQATGFAAHCIETLPPEPNGLPRGLSAREGALTWLGPEPTVRQPTAHVRLTFRAPSREPGRSACDGNPQIAMKMPAGSKANGSGVLSIPLPRHDPAASAKRP